MPRTVHETVRDVVLRAENAVIEARVPRNATLDSILRQHRLSADLVNAAVLSAKSVFNPRQLRADRPYRLVLSLDGFLREFEYENRHRPLPAHHQPRRGRPRRSTPRCSRSRRSRPSRPSAATSTPSIRR
jgi:hypothetical protein